MARAQHGSYIRTRPSRDPMMKMLRATLLTLLAFATLAPAVLAQDRPGRQGGGPDRPGRQERSERPAQSEPAGDPRGVLRLLPADSVTEKQVTVGGKTLAYTATAGTLSLYDQSGERSAAVFYTAYVLKGTDGAKRPLTFAFNGGPGAASAFLHLGLVGPRIADFGPTGYDGAAAKLKDNPDTWLTFTDLVMIDPVSTGWSKPAKPDQGSAFHNISADAESMAKVVALYVAHNSRQTSPKYLLGESYGGFRAAKVARALQADQGIVVSGVVMVSPLLETSFLWGNGREPLRAALQFPSFAAAELDRTRKFTPEALADAERFALNEYLPALAGPPMSGDKAQAFYGQIARLTGVTPDAASKARGYIRSAYLKHLSDEGVQVSSYDASLAMPDPFPNDETNGDPILDGYVRRAVRPVRRLRPRRARLQDRNDLRAAQSRAMGLGQGTRAAGRVRRSAFADCIRSVVQALGRARPQRSGHALRREPVSARSAEAAGSTRPRPAQDLPRRPYVLFQRRCAPSLHHGGARLLSAGKIGLASASP